LNSEAGSLLLRDKDAYNAKVREYVEQYASEDMTATPGTADAGDAISELSDLPDLDLDMD